MSDLTGAGGRLGTAAALPRAQRRREQRGWYVYDWAMSAFSTTVITVFLGPYLTDIAREAAGPSGFVNVLGLSLRPGSVFSWTISVSVLLSAVMMPIVGALADRTQRKRELLGLFAYIGALATMAMYFVEGGRFLLGAVLLIVSNVALSVSVVVYNGYLPEIALPDERDAVSSRGWALGYLGGLILLLGNLALFLQHETFGLTEGEAVRISLLSAGAWWAVFTLVPLLVLRRHRTAEPIAPGATVVSAGFRQLAHTVRELRRYPKTLFFLVAFLLYNEGIQTVISHAALYGAEELGLEQVTLIGAILVVQLVAFVGALALGWLAGRYGAKRTVLGGLLVWMLALVFGYTLPREAPVPFYLLAALIGFVLGGTQALSRSLFAQMIPAGREAEYFSLYVITDKGTSALGPAFFALAFQLTGSYRLSIIFLLVFFLSGFLALLRVPVGAAIQEAGNPLPERL
jgi:UMF1 family MFS transporter